MSPAAILLSENVRCWISVCRGNPTRFDVHVLTLGGDLFRRWQSRVAKQVFYDRLKEQMAAGDTTVGFIPNKKPVPKQVPELNTVIRLIAQRGGFLARKGDGEPRVKSIWLGMQDVAVFVEGMRYARQVGGI